MPEILGRSAIFAGVLYTAFVAWSLYGAVIPVETHMFRMVHLEFIFALGFLVYPISPRPARWSVWLDVGLAVLGVASIIYALFDLEHFIRRSTLPDPLDVFFGIAAILLLLELSRRPVDNTFTLVMVAPALVKVGVSVHVEHLLAFCFAVLSEVSPPVGLSPSATAAITGGNPFGSMMQAWKYSLPAFLVPFFFSVTPGGANLLIIDATLSGFVLVPLTSVVALALLSLGIVGYFQGPLKPLERVLLIAAAVAMALFPIGLSFEGLAPLTAGVLIVLRNLRAHRREACH